MVSKNTLQLGFLSGIACFHLSLKVRLQDRKKALSGRFIAVS
jgi:hypothetical protein